jgi:Uncharacterized conserved protein
MKFFTFLALIAAVFCVSCKERKVDKDTFFEQRIGGAAFSSKIALTDSERMHGLMGVKEMSENEGMIFVFDIPHRASFWMKNTLIPLDIAYADPEGKILQISPMYPHSEVPVKAYSDNVLYCIEMNQGWFAKNNVKTGDRLDIDLLIKAIEARRGAQK